MYKLRSRVISLLALVAFSTTSAADVYGLHECPHHDVLATTVHADPHSTDAHPDHAVMAGADLHAHASPAGDDHHGPCNCVGACSANPPAAPLPDTYVSITGYDEQLPVAAPSNAQPLARLTPYLLPWANAPPLSAS